MGYTVRMFEKIYQKQRNIMNITKNMSINEEILKRFKLIINTDDMDEYDLDVNYHIEDTLTGKIYKGDSYTFDEIFKTINKDLRLEKINKILKNGN